MQILSYSLHTHTISITFFIQQKSSCHHFLLTQELICHLFRPTQQSICHHFLHTQNKLSLILRIVHHFDSSQEPKILLALKYFSLPQNILITLLKYVSQHFSGNRYTHFYNIKHLYSY